MALMSVARSRDTSSCIISLPLLKPWLRTTRLKLLLLLFLLTAGFFSQNTNLHTGHLPWSFTHGTKQSLWNMWLQGVTRTCSLATNASKQTVHSFSSSFSSSSAADRPLLLQLLKRPRFHALRRGYGGLYTCFRSLFIAFLNSSSLSPGSSAGSGAESAGTRFHSPRIRGGEFLMN